jgi:hypothetical protein
VVEVDDGEVQREFGAQFEKDVKETDGVGASRDCNSEMVSGGEHLVAG